MAALTTDELASIRDEVGDTPGDAELQTVYDRVESVGSVIYSVLARRLANLRSNPAQFSVSGEYSQSTQANIAALEKQLSRWSAFAPVQSSLLETVRLLSRHSRMRRPDPNQALDTEA